MRIVFGLRRFSEDLDFSVINAAGYDFGGLCGGLEKVFRLNGLNAILDMAKEKTVNSAFLTFPGLPYVLGLSGHKQEKLSIKIEIDTKPPAGWKMQTAVLNKTYLFGMAH